ncbi:MAG: TRAP transporter large permease subunit, partial [Thermoanaerobaculia bacterium]
ARPFDRAAALDAVRAAKWELLLPVVVLFVLFGGFATPVEAAAVTALYALFVEVIVHRDYKTPSQLLKVFTDSGLLVGGVLLVLGVALGLTGFLVDAEVPRHAADWVTASVHSPLVFLLLLNIFLIVVGALMDIYSAIIVVVPLIVPLGAAFGIDPIHLGIIFLANLELGYLVPPVGENLFIAAYRFDRPIGELARAVMPMVGVLLAGVLAITYIPALSLWLVRLLG